MVLAMLGFVRLEKIIWIFPIEAARPDKVLYLLGSIQRPATF